MICCDLIFDTDLIFVNIPSLYFSYFEQDCSDSHNSTVLPTRYMFLNIITRKTNDGRYGRVCFRVGARLTRMHMDA